ncbi:helix-turn-helix domain-containing protein [Qipengyuania zhejiangensis]|uniref:helix-turn-helix domain-containing protein n=1 Tax=Qipengyuania zhejiangensis TaxID=3077782 RepID=UPI002D78D1AC|nr:AraC family transcriptional regulator [Qipengyuania sp. Z2]
MARRFRNRILAVQPVRRPDFRRTLQTLSTRYPEMASAILPSGVTRYWGQSLGWPDAVFGSTPYSEASAFPEFITVRDDLHLIANLIEEVGEIRLLELIVAWPRAPGHTALVFAPDLETALSTWIVSINASNPHIAVELVREGDTAFLVSEFHESIGAFHGFMELALHLLLLRAISSFTGFASQAEQDRYAIEATSAHASGAMLEALNAVSPFPFRAGQGGGRTSFSASALRVPNPEYKPSRWLRQKLEMEAARPGGLSGPAITSDAVRDLIVEGLLGSNRLLQLPELAQHYGMSERTFARTLAGTSVSLRDIAAEARDQLATDLLSNTDEPVSAISRRLGYTSATSFIRSFRKRAGVAPGEWRRQRLG